MTKIIKIWCGINKDGSISMHSVEPTKNNKLGIWVSNSPFVSSLLKEQIGNLLKKANFNFDNDPEYFEIDMTIPEDES